MTLSSIKNNNAIRIPTLLLLFGLLGLIGFLFKFQGDVDAKQNKQIEIRVRISRYSTDQLILRNWLVRIEGKLDKVLK